MALVPFSHASPFFNLRKLPERLFTFQNKTIRIEQAWKDDGRGGTKLGFGAVVYDAAFVLATYLEDHCINALHSSNVLELGCGTGLVSIVASLLGAKHVLATDGDDEVVELATRNIKHALKDEKYATTCKATKFLWGNDRECKDIQNVTFDFIIAADVVACPYASSFKSLLDSLERLVPVLSNTIILLAYQKRHLSEQKLLEDIKKIFKVRYITQSHLAKDFQQHPIQLLEISRS